MDKVENNQVSNYTVRRTGDSWVIRTHTRSASNDHAKKHAIIHGEDDQASALPATKSTELHLLQRK